MHPLCERISAPPLSTWPGWGGSIPIPKRATPQLGVGPPRARRPLTGLPRGCAGCRPAGVGLRGSCPPNSPSRHLLLPPAPSSPLFKQPLSPCRLFYPRSWSAAAPLLLLWPPVSLSLTTSLLPPQPLFVSCPPLAPLPQPRVRGASPLRLSSRPAPPPRPLRALTSPSHVARRPGVSSGESDADWPRAAGSACPSVRRPMGGGGGAAAGAGSSRATRRRSVAGFGAAAAEPPDGSSDSPAPPWPRATGTR